MIRLSQMQLICLWSELEQAYYGDNKYGGDTAEIYAYTVMPFSPIFMHPDPAFMDRKQEYYQQAAESLVAVVALFAEQRSCWVYIDALTPAEWLKVTVYDHRCKVRVSQ
jgi:hypothetical protein